MHESSLFSHPHHCLLPLIFLQLPFWPTRGDVSLWFWLTFPWWWVVCACWPSLFFSWEKYLFRSFAHYLTKLFLFFLCCVVCMYVFFLCFRNWPLIRYAICKYFLPFSRLLISFHFVDDFLWDPPVAQSVKILPAMQKTWVQSLGL